MHGKEYREFWESRGLDWKNDVDAWHVPIDTDVHQAMTNSGWWDEELFKRIAEAEAANGGQPLPKNEYFDIAQ